MHPDLKYNYVSTNNRIFGKKPIENFRMLKPVTTSVVTIRFLILAIQMIGLTGEFLLL